MAGNGVPVHDILDADAKVFLRPWRSSDAPVVLAAAAEPLMERQFGELIDTHEAAEAWIAPVTRNDPRERTSPSPFWASEARPWATSPCPLWNVIT